MIVRAARWLNTLLVGSARRGWHDRSHGPRTVAGTWLIAASLAGGLTGCSSRPIQTSATSADRDLAPIEVPVVEVVERGVDRSVEIVGNLVADEQVTLSNQVEGTITEIKVDLGSRVRRGQPVVQIDPREFNLQVMQARAALAQARARLGLTANDTIINPEETTIVRQARAAYEEAKSKFESGQKLHLTGDIPDMRFVELENALKARQAAYQAALEEVRQQLALVEARKAELGLAEKRLSDATIVSPIEGGVTGKLVERGQFVKANTALVSIVKDDVLRLRPVVPESAAGALRIGTPVKFTVDAYPGRAFTATITRINPSMDEKARTLVAEGSVPNRGGELRPGMFARIQAVTAKSSPALMVPSSAVLNFAGLNKVFVVEGNNAEHTYWVVERSVKLGLRDGDWVEVVEGVSRGERVANARLDRLENNKLITPSNVIQ